MGNLRRRRIGATRSTGNGPQESVAFTATLQCMRLFSIDHCFSFLMMMQTSIIVSVSLDVALQKGFTGQIEELCRIQVNTTILYYQISLINQVSVRACIPSIDTRKMSISLHD